MSIESTPDALPSPRADLLTALVWAALGAAITVGSWRMDRLEQLHINRYEVPGLVPGLLGAALLLLSLMLALRALRQGALRPAEDGTAAQPKPEPPWRMLLVFVATVGYAVLLVGHGLPFWLATGSFVSLFIFFFDRERQSALGRRLARRSLFALLCGAITSAVVSLAFQDIFYVRLP